MIKNIWRKNREDVIGKKALEVFPELYDQKYPELLNKVYTEGIAHSEKESLALVQGDDGLKKFYLDFEYSPLREHDNSVSGIIITVNNVTENVEARQAAEKAEKASLLLAAIVQSTDDAIISKTTEGIITSWNEAAEHVFGYKAGEMIGKDICTLFPEGYEDEEPKILAKLRQGLRVDHFETRRKHKSGRLIDVSLTISPIKDSAGKVIGASKIARDITRQKQIEKQIKDTRQQLEIVIEASELGTWELNLQTSEIILSDRYLAITGGNQLKKPTHEDLKKLIHPEDLATRERSFKEAFETGVLSYETRLIWPDKTLHWVEARGKLFYDEQNKPLKLIGTIRDITEERSFQQALALNEQRFRSVANTVPVMIWMVGTDKKYTFLNKSWLDFTGLSLEEENALDFSNGIHPDDYENVVPAYIRAFDKQENFYFEYRLKRHDGAYRWISDTGAPQFSIDGVFEGYIGACMDINDRILFEQKLKESESRLRIAALSSELGTWTYYPATRELLWDNSSRELFGVDNETPVTLDLFWEKMHPDDRGQALDKMLRALDPAIADTYDTEYRIIGLPDQKTRWVHGKGKATFNEKNEPVIFAGTVLDITDKRLALEYLQESEHKFRLLADSMPQLIWTGDAEGNLNYFNQSVYDFSGKSPEQVATEGWLQIVHPDDRDENMKQWMEAIRTGRPFLFEHRFKHFDGSYRWQLSRAIPQRDIDGNIQQWVGTSTDIHDQKTFVENLEHQVKLRTRELNMANEELTKSNAELAQFAYVASHDLQEPLRKIQTFSNRILESGNSRLSDKEIDYFNRIQSASQRMQQLIIDLLSFSRANTSEKHFEHTDLNIILKTVQDQLHESIRLKHAEINSDRLPAIPVIAFQFEQLLTNIISNALKFSRPQTSPVINITYTLVAGKELDFFNVNAGRSYHHFSISDNGIGFSHEYNQRIFQVFQRLHGRDKYEGTGIGLAIVKKIVENHNGHISAHGVENEGARFDIYIPLSEEEA